MISFTSLKVSLHFYGGPLGGAHNLLSVFKATVTQECSRLVGG